MKIEQFQIIREISSITKLISEQNEKLADESKRLQFLTKSIQNKQKEREELSIKLHQVLLQSGAIEKEIFEVDSSLRQLIGHSNDLKNQNDISHYEHQSETQKLKLSQLEDDGLKLIEQNAELQTELKKIEQFLTGANTSLSEIESEVNLKKLDVEKNIHNYQDRINGLILELEPNFAKKVDQIIKRKSGDFLTHLRGGSCIKCGLTMVKTDEAEAERGDTLVCCQGCERIILPLNLVG